MYKITIIMGIYNCEKTLDEALASLYAQTCQEWKLVMCDDGSKDGTYEVAKSHADKHDKILLLKNEKNLGLNATLNKCLEYVDTPYTARMDGDDVSMPTRLEKELAFLEGHPEYDIVSGNMIYFDENGDWGRVHPSKNRKKFISSKARPFATRPRWCARRRIDG